MKIGDEVWVHGFVDEIRKDTVIIKNDGGYFGTVPQEIIDVLDYTPCQEVDARCDKAFKAIIDKREEAFKDGEKHGYERACDDHGYIDKSTFDTTISQHEKWAHDKGVEDGINEYANALLTVCRWNNTRRANMFDNTGMEQILWNVDANDIILAVRNYEQEIAEEASRFVVGDEIEAGDGKLKCVVTGITDTQLEYVDKDGHTHAGRKEWCVKTGKHYDGVAELLEKLRGETD